MLKKIRNRTKLIIHIVTAVLISALIISCISAAFMANSELKAFRQGEDTTGYDESTLEGRLAKAIKEIDDLKALLEEAGYTPDERVELYKGRLGEVQDKLDGATLELDDMRSHLEALNGENNSYSETVKQLENSISGYIVQIEYLNKIIDNYETVYSIDVIEQGRIINELLELLTTGAPKKLINTEETSDTGTLPSDNPDYEPEYTDAHIAVYYQDLTTGYKFAYNDNDIFYSASVWKLSYIWSLLKRISAEEDIAAQRAKEYRENEEAKTTGDTDTQEREWPEYIFTDTKYDLSEKMVYNKDKMMQEGSGVIKDMPDGTEFTYLQLVEYALTKSDNIAFALLRERYGYTDYQKDAASIGVKSVRSKVSNMTAAEGGLFLKAIYDFIGSNERYGAFLKSCMINSAHSVIIPLSVYPTTVAHKYGWDIDSYHDIAIVYNNKPYVLVIMTDLDEGSDNSTITDYLKQVVRLINNLHKNFYSYS